MQKNRAIIESFNKGGAAVVGMTSPEEPEEVSGIAASSTRSIAKYEGKVVILKISRLLEGQACRHLQTLV